jgi:RNA polymerase sporulation-specific sigma factor
MKKSSGEIHFEESIDTDKDGNQLTLMDIVADTGCMIEQVDLNIKSEQLYKFIDECLDEREAQIIKLRYGLYGYHPLTQREIADKLNISRSYVSRIEKKALHVLKKKYDKTPLLKG